MIEQLVPGTVVAEEAFADPPHAELFPEEQAVLGRSVDKRRREFTTARVCARAALARLGLAPVPLLPGERGAPQWPAGVVGSMTHCDGYRAAAVARVADVLSLGIDAEPHRPLPDGVLGAISLPEEREQLWRLGGDTHWDRLLFCAKEATYKAWFPLARRWLGFADARITLSPANTFTSDLLVTGPELDSGPLTGFTGRWLATDGLVLTAITLLPGVLHGPRMPQ